MISVNIHELVSKKGQLVSKKGKNISRTGKQFRKSFQCFCLAEALLAEAEVDKTPTVIAEHLFICKGFVNACEMGHLLVNLSPTICMLETLVNQISQQEI